jgi:hypothetical protein
LADNPDEPWPKANKISASKLTVGNYISYDEDRIIARIICNIRSYHIDVPNYSVKKSHFAGTCSDAVSGIKLMTLTRSASHGDIACEALHELTSDADQLAGAIRMTRDFFSTTSLILTLIAGVVGFGLLVYTAPSQKVVELQGLAKDVSAAGLDVLAWDADQIRALIKGDFHFSRAPDSPSATQEPPAESQGQAPPAPESQPDVSIQSKGNPACDPGAPNCVSAAPAGAAVKEEAPKPDAAGPSNPSVESGKPEAKPTSVSKPAAHAAAPSKKTLAKPAAKKPTPKKPAHAHKPVQQAHKPVQQAHKPVQQAPSAN